MANLRFKTQSMLEQIKKLCNRFVKDSMPSTMEEATEYNHRIEDYQMLYNIYSEFEDLSEAYAEKIEKMSDQLDDIQKKLYAINMKLDGLKED